MQLDVVFQGDRTCEPDTLWDNQTTTTLLVKFADALAESVRVKCHAITDTPHILEVNLIGRNDWTTDLLDLHGQILIIL
jgi:hypothetical protein